MLKKITKEEIISIIIFFISFLLISSYNLTDNTVAYDRMWTFHMTQKIAMGELPYKEINIIITPLFYQIGALIFNITGQANFAMYSLYGGLIGAFLALVSYKVIKELTSNKMLSVFATVILSNIMASLSTPSYNLLLLAFILTAALLEMKKENSEKKMKYNIFIGIILGLGAATKHTVGGVVLLVSLLLPLIKGKCFSENGAIKEIINKCIGILIVGIPYLIWLISTGIFNDFVDLTILGMFEFAEKNTSGSFFNLMSLLSVSAIFAVFFMVSELKKQGINEKKWLIITFYAIASLTYSVPLFNFYHTLISSFISILMIMALIIKFAGEKPRNAILATLVALVIIRMFLKASVAVELMTNELGRWNALNTMQYWVFCTILEYTTVFCLLKKYKTSIAMACVAMFIVPIAFNLYIWRSNVKENSEYYIPEYSCVGATNEDMQDVVEVNEYILKKEVEGYNVRVLDIIASKYMIPLHRNNYKYDLMLNGNLGKNGEEALIKEISETENILILRQKPEIETIDMQQPEEIDKFIEKNYKKIGEINDLEIYN